MLHFLLFLLWKIPPSHICYNVTTLVILCKYLLKVCHILDCNEPLERNPVIAFLPFPDQSLHIFDAANPYHLPWTRTENSYRGWPTSVLFSCSRPSIIWILPTLLAIASYQSSAWTKVPQVADALPTLSITLLSHHTRKEWRSHHEAENRLPTSNQFIAICCGWVKNL